jgi:hypothetical protein
VEHARTAPVVRAPRGCDLRRDENLEGMAVPGVPICPPRRCGLGFGVWTGAFAGAGEELAGSARVRGTGMGPGRRRHKNIIAEIAEVTNSICCPGGFLGLAGQRRARLAPLSAGAVIFPHNVQ